MSPRVYAAVNAVTRAFARKGIAKDRMNLGEDYSYRSVDDVVMRLAPLLAKHRLCMLPRVLERTTVERHGTAGELLVSVGVRVAYDLVCTQDRSSHTIESYGEALDSGDKATAKAMQSAYKYAVLQAFAIPVSGSEDADAKSPKCKQPALPTQPVQGWSQWYEDISGMLEGCETLEAVDRVQQIHRTTFASLQRERSELYALVGRAIAGKRATLSRASLVDAPTGAAATPTQEPVGA